MNEKKTWKEFRESGLLWWINMILHTFGWAITIDIDNHGVIMDVYPSRCRYRGFSEKRNSDGYKKVAAYLKDYADDILKDCGA